MSQSETKRYDKEYVVHSWSVQSALDPLVITRTKGVHMWDEDGKRYIDMTSQLMNQNIGHQHPKVIQAIKDQADKLCFVAPGVAYESRSFLGRALAEVTPGDLKRFFFTLSGADANENAVKIARMYTKKWKIITRYRSYHGATYGAIALTGDPRRPPVEPAMPGVVRVFDPYCYRCSFGLTYPGCNLKCADSVEEVIQYETPETVAAVLVESVVGSNGLIVPPDGYMQRLREICTRNDVLLIADEVMSGFGRTGKWFAVDNWGVVPDMITMAKGLTSGYVPLGAVAISRKIMDVLDKQMLWAGLTYNAHPLACGAAIATLKVYEEDKMFANAVAMGGVIRKETDAMKDRHKSVGDARGLGLFWALELVKNKKTREPLVKWNAMGADAAVAKEINKRLLAGGVYTTVRWNYLFIAPPLCIREAELREGLKVIDQALDYADTMAE
ncbi:MAG: aminotransferase class III-fold pyridoxal phosphate-dependent enzyme [Deltaproteobacteria bacterium]|nr:MAG: aminotransferase class III-fold pyridoxal phosphate-dependent enzyme [Deltaproteobacteria bacterium]